MPTRLLSVLNEVWAFLRGNSITPTGHNVVLYDEHGMTAAGVEVFAPLPDDKLVFPAGLSGSAKSPVNDYADGTRFLSVTKVD